MKVAMTQTDSKVLPPLWFYDDFPGEWEHLDPKTQDTLTAFFEQLQTNPYDPSIIQRSEKLGEYYATPVDSLIVFWKIAYKQDEVEATHPDSIHVLAVERGSGR